MRTSTSGNTTPPTYDWIGDDMTVLKRDFLPEDLEPLLAANGFDGSIAVQAARPWRRRSGCCRSPSKNEFIKGVVGLGRPVLS